MFELEKVKSPVASHPREEDRLRYLESFGILHTHPESDFDEITAIASQLCGAPFAFINLIGREHQWTKSGNGAQGVSIPRDQSFCAHTILQDDGMMIVEDTALDDRFRNHPFVLDKPNIRFYAGAQLMTEEKLPLGALCVLDKEPRKLSQGQIAALYALSKQVMQLLSLRQKSAECEKTIRELNQKNEVLGRFAHVAAHDIKSPLNNILTLSRLFENKYQPIIDQDGQTLLHLITVAAENLKNLINGLLDYSTSDELVSSGKSSIEVDEFFGDIRNYFKGQDQLILGWESSLKKLYTNRTVLEQIMLNLISNSVKHGDTSVVTIHIRMEEDENYYHFTVADNGPGIPPAFHEQVFEIFRSFATPGAAGEKSHGIGLATVKKLVELSGGEISLQSTEGEGATFRFSLERSEQAPHSEKYVLSGANPDVSGIVNAREI